eukprot:scaffold9616_cov59-Phaeocystis_antarctica.AAC.7
MQCTQSRLFTVTKTLFYNSAAVLGVNAAPVALHCHGRKWHHSRVATSSAQTVSLLRSSVSLYRMFSTPQPVGIFSVFFARGASNFIAIGRHAPRPDRDDDNSIRDTPGPCRAHGRQYCSGYLK